MCLRSQLIIVCTLLCLFGCTSSAVLDRYRPLHPQRIEVVGNSDRFQHSLDYWFYARNRDRPSLQGRLDLSVDFSNCRKISFFTHRGTCESIYTAAAPPGRRQHPERACEAGDDRRDLLPACAVLVYIDPRPPDTTDLLVVSRVAALHRIEGEDARLLHPYGWVLMPPAVIADIVTFPVQLIGTLLSLYLFATDYKF